MLIISIMIISVLSAIGGININRMTKIVLIYAVMISISVTELSWPGIITGIGVYGGLYEIRPITQYIETYINIIGLIGMVIGGTGVTKRVTKGGQLRVVSEAEAGEAWPIIGLIICLGMSSLISSNEIISIIIGIEWQTLALYIIATIDRRSEASTGAGIKYYLLGALSSCIIGLGLSMIYGVSGVSNIEEWKIIIRIKEGSGHMSITIEWITVGLLFKLGAAPFHNWLADVIDGVSMGIGVWLGVISKISIIMILLIIYNGIMRGQGAPRVIIISIIISLIVGSLVGVVQTRVKPLLAYSSIAHGGYILIGIINDGITCIFYVIQYSMTIINIWMIIKAYGDVGVVRIERLSQIKGIPSTWVGVSITISILSSAGIPPLLGFYGKLKIITSGLERGYNWVTIVAIITSVISGYYYIKVIKGIYMEGTRERGKARGISENHSIIIGKITIVIIGFIVSPEWLYNGIQMIS